MACPASAQHRTLDYLFSPRTLQLSVRSMWWVMTVQSTPRILDSRISKPFRGRCSTGISRSSVLTAGRPPSGSEHGPARKWDKRPRQTEGPGLESDFGADLVGCVGCVGVFSLGAMSNWPQGAQSLEVFARCVVDSTAAWRTWLEPQAHSYPQTGVEGQLSLSRWLLYEFGGDSGGNLQSSSVMRSKLCPPHRIRSPRSVSCTASL